MEPEPNQPPLIVIVGETGSGKSSLAIKLAKQFRGEIIAADSRTIYRGMDIGTAKPSPKELSTVPHHLIDIVDPSEQFTAADFKRLANQEMNSVIARGHVPFMVGGTGLYVDAVLYDFAFRPPPSPSVRAYLQSLDVAQLQKMLMDKGIPLPSNERNPRHLIRAIETGGQLSQAVSVRNNTLVIGIAIDRDELRSRIAKRAESMLALGLLDEVSGLVARFGWDAPGLQSPGYRTFSQYLVGQGTLEEAKVKLITEHIQLAKRQRTWFRRNKNINWLCKEEDIVDLVTTFLNKVYTDTGRSLLQ